MKIVLVGQQPGQGLQTITEGAWQKGVPPEYSAG